MTSQPLVCSLCAGWRQHTFARRDLRPWLDYGFAKNFRSDGPKEVGTHYAHIWFCLDCGTKRVFGTDGLNESLDGVVDEVINE